jgi:hypothetical protein
VSCHSERENAAGNYKGGYGFHTLQAYLDETRESLGGMLRAGNAGSNTRMSRSLLNFGGDPDSDF